jgi:uncharacterized protein (TIGR02118 family)
MYKVIWLTRLNAEKSRDEADRHWREVHAQLMSRVPGVERYVQNLWVSPLDPAIAGPDQYHLHSECWFTDEAAYRAALESPEWAAVVEDSPKCFDNSGLIGAVLEERVMFEAGA